MHSDHGTTTLASRRMGSRRTGRGFTLIEISIALVVLALLVSMAAPVLQKQAQRRQEMELRQALRDIRGALDAYRRAAQQGRIRVPADASGYPPSLHMLAEGVPDATKTDGTRLYFLRRLPRDPFAPRDETDPERTWGLRSYASPPQAPAEGADVFDVYSRAPGVGLNGVPYRDW